MGGIISQNAALQGEEGGEVGTSHKDEKSVA